MTHLSIKEYYTPGNIIYVAYWNSYDLVVDFNEELLTHTFDGDGYQETRSFKSWNVDVIACTKHGVALYDAILRNHQTSPDIRLGDKVVGNITELSIL